MSVGWIILAGENMGPIIEDVSTTQLEKTQRKLNKILFTTGVSYGIILKLTDQQMDEVDEKVREAVINVMKDIESIINFF